jgi:7-cyano-7-deazaguanine synthase
MSRVLLLSGGMDSAALAYQLRPELSVTIDYGQLCAGAEIAAASQICQELELEHLAVDLRCSDFGSGDLAGKAASAFARVSDWWPFRNQFLITVGAMIAVDRGYRELLFGSVRTDRQHGDGSPEFFSTLNTLLRCQEGEIFVRTPALEWDTVELVKESGIPIDVLAWSHSCHTSDFACGECRGCHKHIEVLTRLGYRDESN